MSKGAMVELFYTTFHVTQSKQLSAAILKQKTKVVFIVWLTIQTIFLCVKKFKSKLSLTIQLKSRFS